MLLHAQFCHWFPGPVLLWLGPPPCMAVPMLAALMWARVSHRGAEPVLTPGVACLRNSLLRCKAAVWGTSGNQWL